MCRVGELTLINEHLQNQLAESQAAVQRLSEDVHHLSISLSETQERMREEEREHKQHISVSSNFCFSLHVVEYFRLFFCLLTFSVASP